MKYDLGKITLIRYQKNPIAIQRERQRQRDRERERQTDRQTDRQTETERETQRERESSLPLICD